MNKTELIQLQNTQKEMLRSFAELCDKYQIHYLWHALGDNSPSWGNSVGQ